MKYLKKMNEHDKVNKVIMNCFIHKYSMSHDPKWEESVKILKKLKLELPTSVEISGSHHHGLGFQALLDTNLEESIELSEKVLKLFPEEPLIVLSEVEVVMKHVQIGEWQDEDLIEPGRYFDRLVRIGKRGLFIYR